MAKKFGLTTGIVFVSIQIGGYTKNDDINLSLNGFDNPPTGVKRYVVEIKGLLNYSSKHMNRAEKSSILLEESFEESKDISSEVLSLFSFAACSHVLTNYVT